MRRAVGWASVCHEKKGNDEDNGLLTRTAWMYGIMQVDHLITVDDHSDK